MNIQTYIPRQDRKGKQPGILGYLWGHGFDLCPYMEMFEVCVFRLDRGQGGIIHYFEKYYPALSSAQPVKN